MVMIEKCIYRGMYRWKFFPWIVTCMLFICFVTRGIAQETANITVRFANPTIDCAEAKYCLDVEFQADMEDVELFGINMRFFYDHSAMQFDNIYDLQGNYCVCGPNGEPVDPEVDTGPPGFGSDYFGLPDPGFADYVNAPIYLLPGNGGEPIYISTSGWTKLFRICFILEDSTFDNSNFCPSVIFDLREDPLEGGYLIGDDGVVITQYLGNDNTWPTYEHVIQYNWEYSGDGESPPFGMPIEEHCVDITCPLAIVCAPDITVSCGSSTDPESTGYPTSWDRCDGDSTITYIDMDSVGNCSGNYFIIRKWEATNDCMEVDSCIQLITFIDTTSPAITCPVNLTIECTESAEPLYTGYASAIDNCDVAPAITYEDVTVAGFCPQQFIITRTWLAEDDCGNLTSCIQVITIADNTAPVFTSCPSDITIACNESSDPLMTGMATATDNCDSNPTVTYNDDIVTGPEPGTYTITRTWIATDACGNTSTCNQFITGLDEGSPVITFCPSDITIECDESTDPLLTGMASATDNCDLSPLIGYSDLTISGDCLHAYTIERTWTATDISGNTATCQQVILIRDSTPPLFTLCPSDIIIECDESIDPLNTGVATATDNCDGMPVITYSDVTIAGVCENEYAITRTWVATDACGNTTDCVQTISIEDQTPPFIACPSDLTVSCSGDVPGVELGMIVASDNCDGETEVTLIEEIISNQLCANQYTLIRVYMATDVCGNTSTCAQSIVINDAIAPSIVFCPIDVTLECNESTDPSNTGLAQATDNCNGITIVSYSDVVMPGMLPQELTITRTWIATDECGNEASCLQMIYISDDAPPVITYCPEDITIACDESTDPSNTGLATATDNCFSSPVITYNDITVAGDCSHEYTITRVWTFTDEFDNSSTCEQVILVHDTTSPEFTFCPGDITIECDESTDPLITGMASATDNCDEAPVVSYSDITIAGVCSHEYSIQRIWIATDDCLNTSICIQTISVEDHTPPEFTFCPDDLTIECLESTDPIATGIATAIDNCDVSPEMSYSDAIIAGSCINEYTITRTWVATDACGNSSLCEQVISIKDNTPPTIMCPASVTIECDESTMPGNTGIATAMDVCDGSPVITYSDDILPGGCPQAYDINRIWVATDACGNSSTCEQMIAVEDNTPVMITFCPPAVTVECDESTLPGNTGFATASDNCGVPDVSFSDVIIPGGCSLEYTITRTWIAADACGNSSTCEQVIEVEDNIPVMITFCPSNVTIECDESTLPVNTGMATASDNCGTPTIMFSDVIVPGGCPQNFIITRLWTASDECGNSSTCEQIIQVEDNTAPVITCPPGLTIECDESTLPGNTGVASAIDNCDGAPVVTYSDVTIAGGCSQEYSITRVWVATDACGNSSTCGQVISVEDSTPPAIICPVNITVACDESTMPGNTGTALATDICDGAPDLTYNDATTPGGCPQEFTIIRTWIATDACGNSSTCEQIISIEDNILPTILCPASVTIECDESSLPGNTGVAIAMDFCDGSPMVTYSDEILPGGCPQEYEIIRSWIANDACGNSSTCEQMITVEDNTPVMITFCPPAVTVECDESTLPGNTGMATASDNCGTPDIIFSDILTPGGCPQNYMITRLWTATDDCGNSSTCEQEIQVEDNTAPVITCPPGLTIDCDESTLPGNTGMAVANDNCDGSPVMAYSDVITAGGCPEEFIITRTWMATDACGNISICEQTIHIEDNTAPAITCPPNLTIACNENTLPVNTGMAMANDICDALPEVIYVDVFSAGGCPQEYTITRIWIATDACDNSSSCSQVITIDDNAPPAISCPPNVTVSCDEDTLPGSTGMATANDICDGAPGVTYSDQILSGGCVQEYYIIRTWIATDACGNSSTCEQEIQVEDNTAPSITCPANLTIECEENTLPDNTGIAIANDNCGVPTVTFSDAFVPGGCPEVYTIIRIWTASDGCGNSSTCEQEIDVEDNTAPVITCPANLTIECDENTLPDNTGVAKAIDNCDGSPEITYNDAIIEGGCPQEYMIIRVWTVTDGCGHTATCQQVISVEDTTPPLITSCPADTLINCFGDIPEADPDLLMAMDNCGGQPIITFVGESVINQICSNQFTLIRTYMASDQCGNTSTCTQAIMVSDSIAPTIACPPDTTVLCADLVPVPNISDLVIIDNCDDTDFTFAFEDGITDSICANRYIIHRKFIIADACGNSAECIQQININDTIAPVINANPVSRMVSGCGVEALTNPPFSLVTASSSEDVFEDNTNLGNVSDVCGIASVNYIDIVTGTCPMIITRTWTLTDACDQSSTCTQTITVDDSIGPHVIACAVSRHYDDCDVAIITDPVFSTEMRRSSVQVFKNAANQGDVSDDCGISGVTYIDVKVFGCPTIINRTWTFSDACGNSSSCVQKITLCAKPDESLAGDDQALCNQSFTTLTGNDPLVGTGMWSVVQGTANILTPSSPVSQVTGLLPNESVTLAWTISNGFCPAQVDEVIISNSDSTSAAFAGDDLTVCDTGFFLSAEIPLLGTGEWSLLYGSGTIVDPFDPHSNFSNAPYGTEIGFEWTVRNGGCPSKSDTVVITTASKLDDPFAGTDKVYCDLPLVLLEASIPGPGKAKGHWSLYSGEGVIADPDAPSTSVTDLGIGKNVFVWTVSNGFCPSKSDTVSIFNTGEDGIQANFLISEMGCTDQAIYIFDISDNITDSTAYLWDFGDNTISFEADPVHYYTTSGIYTVTLIIYQGDCASLAVTKEIRIVECLLNEPDIQARNEILFANVYPNPSANDFNVKLKLREENDVLITLCNLQGQVVEEKQLIDETEVLTAFSTEAPGLYFIKIKVKDEVLVFKILKVK